MDYETIIIILDHVDSHDSFNSSAASDDCQVLTSPREVEMLSAQSFQIQMFNIFSDDGTEIESHVSRCSVLSGHSVAILCRVSGRLRWVRLG